MAGNVGEAVRILIAADDQASSVMDKVGNSADRMADRLKGINNVLSVGGIAKLIPGIAQLAGKLTAGGAASRVFAIGAGGAASALRERFAPEIKNLIVGLGRAEDGIERVGKGIAYAFSDSNFGTYAKKLLDGTAFAAGEIINNVGRDVEQSAQTIVTGNSSVVKSGGYDPAIVAKGEKPSARLRALRADQQKFIERERKLVANTLLTTEEKIELSQVRKALSQLQAYIEPMGFDRTRSAISRRLFNGKEVLPGARNPLGITFGKSDVTKAFGLLGHGNSPFTKEFGQPGIIGGLADEVERQKDREGKRRAAFSAVRRFAKLEVEDSLAAPGKAKLDPASGRFLTRGPQADPGLQAQKKTAENTAATAKAVREQTTEMKKTIAENAVKYGLTGM